MHTKFTCEYLNAHIFYSCKWDAIRILFFLYIFMEIPCKNIFFTNHYLETNILVTHNNCGIKNTTIFKTGFSMLIKVTIFIESCIWNLLLKRPKFHDECNAGWMICVVCLSNAEWFRFAISWARGVAKRTHLPFFFSHHIFHLWIAQTLKD